MLRLRARGASHLPLALGGRATGQRRSRWDATRAQRRTEGRTAQAKEDRRAMRGRGGCRRPLAHVGRLFPVWPS
jgi:hypothetical protein